MRADLRPIRARNAKYDQTNDIVIENLCDSNFNAEFNEQSMLFVPDYQQLERVRIELLERGFNPGFGAEQETTMDTELMDAVAHFQSEYHLPVTGQVDANTLAALNIAIQEFTPTISEVSTQRTKPSK